MTKPILDNVTEDDYLDAIALVRCWGRRDFVGAQAIQRQAAPGAQLALLELFATVLASAGNPNEILDQTAAQIRELFTTERNER